ncbi:hypothetical protein PYV02_10395 [Leifsonia sp. H3M29-4]|nr:hypothetical protein [Salinibacterium metalliresistens]MDF1479490.1 hypothetical protein [Salinibacterium metalliresistens]
MTDQTPQFVRYRARIPNARGVKVGIFALANGLAQNGRLAVEDEAWLREANDWYNRAYPNPSDVDPGVYDRVVNPGAVSWFKVGASDALIERLADYVRLLDAHSVEWERVVTARPGRIVYEDEVQVVAVPERGDRALVRVCSRALGTWVRPRSLRAGAPLGSTRSDGWYPDHRGHAGGEHALVGTPSRSRHG